MTDTTTTPLTIPDDEFEVAAGLDFSRMSTRGVRLHLLSITAPIVAAELRRLADELDVVREEMRMEDDRTVRSSGLGEGIRRMRARADEIERATA